MNAILPRPSQPVLTSTLAVWRAQPGALMILGRASGPLPKTGAARTATSGGTLGVFRAESWPLATDSEHGFLAVIRMPDRADPAVDADMVLRGARTSDRDFRLRLPIACGEAEFGEHVAASAGLHAAGLARFMLDLMRTEDGSDMRRPHEVLAAFLARAARQDGCVELMLHAPGHCMVLQGWGTRLSHPAEIISFRQGLQRLPMQLAEFARSDVPAPATGVVLVLPTEAHEALAGAETLIILSGDQLLSRNVVERNVLDHEASIGQIRHLLPRLNAPDTVHAVLHSALRPQFSGKDTLNASARPVRAAVDIAVDGGPAGAFISGWIFDPSNQVVEASYCSEIVTARLDDTWVRVRREDVSAAFKSEPAFPAPSHHDAGFVASISVDPCASSAQYLRFSFADGEIAFLPIVMASARSDTARQKALQSVDLHKPSGVQIVEEHLAPFFSRLDSIPHRPGRVLLQGPLSRKHAIVVPLRSTQLPRSLIANFLHDPASADEQLIFACSSDWDYTELEALMELVRFYALPATVVALAEAAEPSRAVLEAASISSADTLLLLSPTIAGQGPGWRRDLVAASSGSVATCPTVFYEDQSIRFAGSTELEFTDRSPFARLRSPMAGLAAGYAVGDQPVSIESGTLACCVLRRATIPALQRSTRFMTAPGQEAALFMELREAGLVQTWFPAVRVSAPDEETFNGSISSLVDGWMLRQEWRNAACAS